VGNKTVISLSDKQMEIILAAARAVPVEKRNIFLKRDEAALRLSGNSSYADFDAAVKRATEGLVHQPLA
jgi:hypothetical protein